MLSALLFARAVFDGATLGLGYGSTVLRLVHSKLALHTGLSVKHLPDRGRFVPAMLLIGERLEGSIEGKGKSDRDGRGFLVSHAADRVILNMTAQEKIILDRVYDTIIHIVPCPERNCQKAVSR